MKFHILYDLSKTPWGGANQFLKALKNELIVRDLYTDNLDSVDVLIVNSHHWFDRLDELKSTVNKNPNLVIIHRIDGPISFARGTNNDYLDKMIVTFSDIFARGIVYQSLWSQNKHIDIGLYKEIPSKIIYNAPDKNIFNCKDVKNFHREKRIRIISSSWSANKNKGFGIYKFLDENLDFSKYEMCFVGNTSLSFKNIKHIPAVGSKRLSELLRRSDLFIQASEIEACSNALIEAMHCGLVPIAKNSSSNPELIQFGGVLFNDHNDIIDVIDDTSNNLSKHKSSLDPPSIEKVTDQYVNFARELGSENKTLNWKVTGVMKIFFYNYLYKIRALMIRITQRL